MKMMENVVLSLPKDKFTDAEFYQFCLDNPDWKFERDAKGQIIIMANTGGNTGRLNSEINLELGLWNRSQKLGVVFDSSTAFLLPSTAVRSPDAAWVSNENWNTLPPEQKEKFPPLCPDFVIELMSPHDTFKDMKNKMLEEWIGNGCRLAWLIDPKTENVHIFRANGEIVIQSFDKTLSGEDVLLGFELALCLLK
jgi:Uma2 family endonuclease